MIDRCYLEITNICNLDCVFCPKNARVKRRMSRQEFETLTDRLQGKIRFLYFHLMGEPFLHAELSDFIAIAKAKGFVPIVTTNGTLLARRGASLSVLPHKFQISLHSQEGNGIYSIEDYVREVMLFSLEAARKGCIVVLRLWNQGGLDSRNGEIEELISSFVPRPWIQRYDGWKLADNLYLEYDKLFEWPDEEHAECGDGEVFCYALRNQIGVLVDGSVVPCCLDHEGSVVLGDLFETSLEEILSSPRAKAIYEGFTHHEAVENLCKRCDYASVTKRFRK